MEALGKGKMTALFLNLIIYYLFLQCTGSSPVDLTLGFTEQPLSISNFHHHSPNDLPMSARYSLVLGISKLWVYSTDKPFSRNSPTKPISEIRVAVSNLAHHIQPVQAQVTKNNLIPHLEFHYE